MDMLHKILGRADISKMISKQRSRDGVVSLAVGLAAGLTLGYFACVCAKHTGQSSDDADMRRRRVGLKPSMDVIIPDSVKHTVGWHTNARGMVMCNQQFIPKNGEVKAVVGLCHGYTDHSHGFMLDLAIKLCADGFAVITMDVEGHGLSDGLHGAVHDLKVIALDLSEYFLDQLSALGYQDKAFFVYGHSMGGANVFNMCTLPECTTLRQRVTGAIMCAPMVKIADEMKPNSVVIAMMGWLAEVFPLAPVTPVPDLLKKCFREESAYERASAHPLHFHKKPRLLTGLALLAATEDITDRMEQLTTPVLILHGADDVVTDPALSQVLHDRCSSVDKSITIYPKAWHDLLAGEPEYMRRMVYADLVSWMTSRCC